jgi:hypothetical protein
MKCMSLRLQDEASARVQQLADHLDIRPVNIVGMALAHYLKHGPLAHLLAKPAKKPGKRRALKLVNGEG